MTFKIDGDELKRLNEWMAKKTPKYGGAIGGRFVYTFCHTTLGTVVKVRDDIDKDEIDLSDYEGW
jgi:uncharacterized FAD-dependent dehydrogenase